MNFPQYRRYKNKKSYFKIVSQEEFIEYKLNVNNKVEKIEFKASILPDRVLINDMLYSIEPYWEVIELQDLEVFLKRGL